MLIAWTTLGRKEDAENLARAAIELHLAACVQIDGPITSVYRWSGQMECSEEYRLMFKFLADQHAALKAHVLSHHPYTMPEWIVVAAEHVDEKYLSWARANTNSSPL
jgi:periplasmic divalent cation tolerance protein